MVLACAFTGFAVHLTMRSSSPPTYRRIVPAQMIGPHVAGPYTGEKVEFWDKARTAAPDQRICPTPVISGPGTTKRGIVEEPFLPPACRRTENENIIYLIID
uniref:Uncharacterized protein n=1 Tax=Anopheles coluzzii TaxID=1518534 RepID=A0A8W7PB43_ANOCL